MTDHAVLNALDAETSREPDTDHHQHAIPLAPLAVSGLVVRKADLIATLQTFVPTLADITLIDADRFLLHLGQPTAGAAEG